MSTNIASRIKKIFIILGIIWIIVFVIIAISQLERVYTATPLTAPAELSYEGSLLKNPYHCENWEVSFGQKPIILVSYQKKYGPHGTMDNRGDDCSYFYFKKWPQKIGDRTIIALLFSIIPVPLYFLLVLIINFSNFIINISRRKDK